MGVFGEGGREGGREEEEEEEEDQSMGVI